MPTGILERFERPAYTGENRCTPCTVLNLLVAAGLAVLVGRRSRALGLVTFLAAAGAVYLRGYLVPGTPELTERYLPDAVLARFDHAEPPADDLPPELRSVLEARADDGTDEAVPDETPAEVATDGGTPDDRSDEASADAADLPPGVDPEDPDPDVLAAATHAEREAVEALLDEQMDVVLESFDVVEPEGEDLRLTDAFRDRWTDAIDVLADRGERLETIADVFRVPVGDVDIEVRDDDMYYGLVEGRSRHNWITEAALLSDLAAHRAIAAVDPRWSALTGAERCSIAKGFRVFLETCPSCGGRVDPTDDSVESCCRSWQVIALRCLDCEARVLEIPAEEQPDEVNVGMGVGSPGITR